MKSSSIEREGGSFFSRGVTDVVGLELGAGHAEGVPAVRLRGRGEGVTELVAAGFVKLEDELPVSASAASKVLSWVLPRAFQAPCAALAVRSVQGVLRHTAVGSDDGGEVRSVSAVTFPDTLPLVASLPEYQAAWVAQLLPEGRMPTAVSIQLGASAVLNGFGRSPLYRGLQRSAIVMFVFERYTALAAYDGGGVALYREHGLGYGHLLDAACSTMKIDVEMAAAMLGGSMIDPMPIVEPILKPLFRQVEIVADYMQRRRGVVVEHFYVAGLRFGARLWADIFVRTLNRSLMPFHPFDGLRKPQRYAVMVSDIAAAEPDLMTALGAARAVLEES